LSHGEEETPDKDVLLSTRNLNGNGVAVIISYPEKGDLPIAVIDEKV
jgi:hypothetical protein